MPLVNGRFEEIVLPERHLRVLTDRSKDWRFRSLWGGRNGAKDWSMAIVAVEMAVRSPMRWLFTREVQKTLKASAHQLLEDTIKRLGYQAYFTITRDEIRANHNDSQFLFTGLNDLVAGDLKSIEGMDRAVICEAEGLTKKSFDILNFTVRKPFSEIWFQFNTRYEDDFVYEFCVKNPPDNMITEQVNGFAVSEDDNVIPADNPWISPEQIIEATRLYRTDKPAFRNQCLGKPVGQGGRIWTTWGDKNIRTYSWEEARLNGNCFCAMDPHSKYFPALGWFALLPVDSDATRFVTWWYNEWPTVDMFDGKYFSEIRHSKYIAEWGTLLDFAKEVYRMDGTADHGLEILKRFMDTRFDRGAGGDNWSTNTSGMASELRKRENGALSFESPPVNIIDIQREVILKELALPNSLMEAGPFNDASTFVAPWCKNIIQSMQLHRLEEDCPKEDEKYKDFSDMMRIGKAGVANHKWVDLNKQRQRRREQQQNYAYAGGGGWMA